MCAAETYTILIVFGYPYYLIYIIYIILKAPCVNEGRTYWLYRLNIKQYTRLSWNDLDCTSKTQKFIKKTFK